MSVIHRKTKGQNVLGVANRSETPTFWQDRRRVNSPRSLSRRHSSSRVEQLVAPPNSTSLDTADSFRALSLPICIHDSTPSIGTATYTTCECSYRNEEPTKCLRSHGTLTKHDEDADDSMASSNDTSYHARRNTTSARRTQPRCLPTAHRVPLEGRFAEWARPKRLHLTIIHAGLHVIPRYCKARRCTARKRSASRADSACTR
ncbi:hypothetical protein CALCODRAFT_500769 [Calocera cornea HHB12733]|uniref:Uncharacterized protein n=1 Tax=Calocera cornea HHB12733 TaxID=1353952 RepID=A0A165DXA7_9BASI|nr:hypothetical protein CALCODRAFT_500769 [Calocera cornea HHB12733]